jgi:hypothetical protein
VTYDGLCVEKYKDMRLLGPLGHYFHSAFKSAGEGEVRRMACGAASCKPAAGVVDVEAAGTVVAVSQ